MRGSIDVVDAERLQRSGVAMVWVGRRGCIKTYNAAPDKVYNSVPVSYT